MIDDEARDRILKQMRDEGGVPGYVADLLGAGIRDDGGWDPARVNIMLAVMTDRDVMDRSTEVLRRATEAEDLEEWRTLEMIDAVLDTFDQRDVEPLEQWIATYADELDR